MAQGFPHLLSDALSDWHIHDEPDGPISIHQT